MLHRIVGAFAIGSGIALLIAGTQTDANIMTNVDFDVNSAIYMANEVGLAVRGGNISKEGVPGDVDAQKFAMVIGGGGKVEEPYDVLVIATGSRPFMPPAISRTARATGFNREPLQSGQISRSPSCHSYQDSAIASSRAPRSTSSGM